VQVVSLLGAPHRVILAGPDVPDWCLAWPIRRIGFCRRLLLASLSNRLWRCDGGDPSGQRFAYTVGLFGLGHPELLIFGVAPGAASGVLNELCSRVRNGQDFVPGQLLTFEGFQLRIIVEPVPNPGQIVLAANRHCQRPPEASVPVYQLTYDDPAGRFPWEADYAGPEVQPRPGRFRA
jgi:Domain of unknown function (DUF4262)